MTQDASNHAIMPGGKCTRLSPDERLERDGERKIAADERAAITASHEVALQQATAAKKLARQPKCMREERAMAAKKLAKREERAREWQQFQLAGAAADNCNGIGRSFSAAALHWLVSVESASAR